MAADLPPLPPDPTPPPAIIAPAPAEVTPIVVEENNGYRYVITGNTLLSPEAVEAAVRTGATPKEAGEALNKAYQAAGYVLVFVGGNVNGKLVALQVVEGRISEQDMPPDLVPYFAGIVGRDDLTRNQLLRAAAMVEFYDGRQGLRPKAGFSPAQDMGGTKLTVTQEDIEGAKPYNVGLAFGNLGSRYSSRYTGSGNVALRPGGGLELTAAYTQGIPGLTADSAASSYKAAVLGASLVTPLGYFGLTYSDTRYRIGEITFPLYPAGEIETGGITANQLVFADESSRFTVTESLMHFNNKQDVYDGLNTITDQSYGVASVGVVYNRSFAMFEQNASINANATLYKGLSAAKGSLLPEGPGVPDPRFALIQANVTVTSGLPWGFTTGASLNGQYTNATLPQNQQWVMGGLGNLSAWLPAVTVGDIGLLGRASLSAPAYRWSEFSFNGALFVEAGVTRLNEPPILEPWAKGLGDVGISISGSTATGTSLTLAFAQPVWYWHISETARESVNRARANLYFSVNQSF